MAATDCTLLALAGTGHASRRSFGFASCNRAVGASEGMNVLQRRKRLVRDKDSGELVPQYEYGVTNVEYTEFTRLGIEDKTADGGTESAFPANTNILYVGMHLVLLGVSPFCSDPLEVLRPKPRWRRAWSPILVFFSVPFVSASIGQFFF
jgi:hypothetical protein